MTGSGFHDEPPVVSRSRCATSLPHTIHDHESCVGTDGSVSEIAASTKQPRTSSGSTGRLRRCLGGGAASVAGGDSIVCVTPAREDTRAGGVPGALALNGADQTGPRYRM